MHARVFRPAATKLLRFREEHRLRWVASYVHLCTVGLYMSCRGRKIRRRCINFESS